MSNHRSLVWMAFAAIMSLLLLLLLLATSPAVSLAGLLDPTETAQRQTVEAMVADNLTQTAAAYSLTQTAVIDDLYATAEAGFQPTPTATRTPSISDAALARAIEAYEIGWVRYAEGDMLSAVMAFGVTIENAPTWAEGYAGRGIAEFELEWYDNSRVDLERAIELAPPGGDLLSWHAIIAEDDGDYDVAIADYELWLTLRPNCATAYGNRAYMYMDLGRHDDALIDFNRAIELDPTLAYVFAGREEYYSLYDEPGYALHDIYIGNGLRDYDDGDYGHAVYEFTRSVNNTSPYNDYTYEFAIANFNLGRAQMALGNLDLAAAAFEEALILNPNLVHALIGQGDLLARQGQWEEALSKYDLAVMRRPQLAEGYLKRADAHAALGHASAAAADYWAWVQFSEIRPIIWNYYTDGDPFIIHLEDTWTYYIRITGEAGQLINVTAETLTSNNPVDPLLILLDSAGNPLAANNNRAADTVNADLQNVILPASGKYTLVVSYALIGDGPAAITIKHGDVLVAADLTATATAQSPTPTSTATPTATASASPTVTPTGTVTATPTPTLVPGAYDFQLYRVYDENDFHFLQLGPYWVDDSHIIVGDLSDEAVYNIERSSLRKVRDFDSGEYFNHAALSPNRQIFALAATDQYIGLFDVQTGEEIRRLRGQTASLSGITFSPDNTRLIASDYDSNIIVWDVATGDVLSKRDDFFLTAAFSPEGTQLATAHFFGFAIWDIDASGALTPVTNIDASADYGDELDQTLIAYSPDGSLLAYADGNIITLWDTTNFTRIGELAGHTHGLNALAFSPDGMLLASGGDDRIVRVWHIPDQREIAVFEDGLDDEAVSLVQFSPSGNRLGVQYSETTIRIWALPGAFAAATSGSGADASGASGVSEAATTAANIQAAQYVTEGWRYYANDEYEAAIDAFDAAILLTPDWLVPYMGRGITAYLLDEEDTAREDFQHVLDADPENVFVLGWLGALETWRGNFTDAIRALNQAIRLDPYNDWAYDNRGYSYLNLNDYDRALADLSTAIRLYPFHPQFFNDRSQLYETTGEIDRAIFDSYLRAGLDAFEAGDYEAAIRQFEQALLDVPDLTTPDPLIYAYVSLARAHMELDQPDEARAALDQASDLDPEFAYAHYYRGRLALDDGDYAAAIDALTLAIKEHPDNLLTYLYRAQAYEAIDQIDMAQADYWQVVARGYPVFDWPYYQPGEFMAVWSSQRVYHIPFAGTGGQTVTIDVESVDEDGVDRIIGILDGAGNQLALSTSGQLQFTLPDDATYTFVLTGGINAHGEVRFRLSFDGGAPASPAEPTTPPTAAPITCDIRATTAVNLRTGPGTTFDVAGTLDAGQTATVSGQATGADGFVWWTLGPDQWVRSDVVETLGDCAAVPVVPVE